MDEGKAQAFGGRMIGMINEASLALMLSVGHRAGLLDAMASLAPSTPAEVAQAAGLQERYVREWLGGMVAAQVVETDPATGRYWLPPEHAAFLTTAAGANNIAEMAQFISLLGNVEDQVLHSFRAGGGVPYSQYPRFQALMAESSASMFDQALIDVILALVPGLSDRLRAGIDVLDVGCGSGRAINIIARTFPASRLAGYDISEEAIAAAGEEAARWGLSNARFEVRDVAALDGAGKFDLITAFDAIHDQAHPRRVLKGIAASLRPDGLFLCADIQASSYHHENVGHPLGTFLYGVSLFHCMTVSLALGGEGLGTVWGEQKARELMQEAGFREVRVARVPGDFFNNYYIATL